MMVNPLCKEHCSKPGLTEKFELLVCRTEVVDGNSDLNDPVEVRKRFQQQAKDKAKGDHEVCC